MGHWDEWEVPMILKDYQLIDEAEAEAPYAHLGKAEAEALYARLDKGGRARANAPPTIFGPLIVSLTY